jgi:hypothetical protein
MIDDPKRELAAIPPASESQQATPPPWQEIENGRFMPRRIRGSYLGRELG